MRAVLSVIGLFGCMGDKGSDSVAPEGCVFGTEDVDPSPVQSLYASDEGVVWASNGGPQLCFDDGSGWRTLDPPAGATNSVGLDGGSARLYTRDNSSLYRYDGAWSEIRFPDDAEIGSFLVRETGKLHTLGTYESDCCEDCEPPTYWYQLQRFDGVAWDLRPDLSTSASLGAMTEVDGTLVLVGDGGLILAEDGGDWDPIVVETDALLTDATASGDELVAVGAGGVLVSGPLDGLTVRTLDPSLDLLAVRAEPSGALWILAGAPGDASASTVIHVEGESWTAIDPGVQGLTALAVVGDDDLVLGGWDAGAVLVRGGTGGFVVEVDGPE